MSADDQMRVVRAIADALADRLLEMWARDAGLPLPDSPANLAGVRTRPFPQGGTVCFSNPRAPFQDGPEFVVPSKDELAAQDLPRWPVAVDVRKDGLHFSSGEFIPWVDRDGR